MLLENGLFPVTLAYPLTDVDTVKQLLDAAPEENAIRFIADSLAVIETIVEAARRSGRKATVFLKVNVGLNRCGVDPTDASAIALASMIDRHPSLIFAGLLSHAGHAYGAAEPERIRAIAATEREILLELRRKLEAAGIVVPVISVGSTPTILANAGFEGIDEIRPGNYVFYDLTAVRLGLVKRNELALGVAARIISVNSHYAIANVGSKTLSSDLGAHGTSGTSTYGEAWVLDRREPLRVMKLSEEHAFLEPAGQPLEIGTAVLILPNHSCPVANLSGGLTFLSGQQRPNRRVAVEGVVKP
jgi:D-serine deaminase-like pyridoxal phosphate-dependent protein